MSEWTIFGERLKKQLEECGMTYREFAKKAGVSVTTICRFVNCDTVPRATEVLKIANVLGVNCNYLLGVINEPYKDCLYHPKKSTVAENANVQDDLISRQNALDMVRILQTYKLFEGDDMVLIDKATVQTELMMLPSVEPERKKGKWIHKKNVYGVVYCSECDYELHTNDTNFCPNCGSKMEASE